jgi:hypothetical protein
MDFPNHPDDREKKLKGLLAGERGSGFAEIMPESRINLPKLKALIAGNRKRRRKRQGKQ